MYVFNGDVREDTDSEDDTIESFGANAGYKLEKDNFTLNAGMDYISNILDSDGLGDGFSEASATYLETNPDGSYGLKDYVAGFGAHLVMGIGPVTLIGEYISAIDDPEVNTDDGAGTTDVIKTDGPSAYHLECAYAFEVKEKEITLACTYQATDNLSGTLPETRYGGAAGIGLYDNLSLAVEYMHDEDYDTSKGGTDKSAEIVTAQLALEF